MNNVKIGILGAGYVANTFHMPSLHEIDGAEVVAAFSHRKEEAEQFSRRWNIPKAFYGDDGIKKLCADPEVELVDIVLPNNLHPEAALAAAENHKNIVCEKPLARNQIEAKEMLDIVRKHGVLHFYAENQVFMPQVSRAKGLIQQRSLGDVFWVRCREAFLTQRSRWFWNPSEAGGGAIIDLGVHAVEVARFLIGQKPVSVLGWASKFTHETPAEDNGLILVKHDGSALSQAENTWVTRGGLEIRIEVHGGNGTLFLTNSREAGINMFTTEGTTRLNGRGETISDRTETKKGRFFPTLGEHQTLGFVDEFRHFISSIATGEKASETFEEGYLVNRIIDAAYKSSKNLSWEQL